MKRARIMGLTGRFWIINQIATPAKAMIYVGDSDELLKITVNISVEERYMSWKTGDLYCLIRIYGRQKRIRPVIRKGKLGRAGF